MTDTVTGTCDASIACNLVIAVMRQKRDLITRENLHYRPCIT